MSSQKLAAFSFLYVRRGQTTLWDQKISERSNVIDGETPGTKLGMHDQKQEWYRVIVELSPDEDMDEAYDCADDQAEAEFLRNHPNHHVAD